VSITPSIMEDGQATLSGTIADPGPQNTFTLVVDWGDGSSPQTFSFTATNSTTTPFSITHTFTANGTLSVGLTVTDKDGGQGTAVASINVDNVPPTVSNVAITPVVSAGSQATLSGTITDPGTTDHFRLVVDWGDGSSPQTFMFTANGSTTTPFAVTHT